MRVWHDQALIKQPHASATSPHTDNPYWSFSSFHAISLWVALDDATAENGALYFEPGSHRMLASGLGAGASARADCDPFEEVKIGADTEAIYRQFPELSTLRGDGDDGTGGGGQASPREMKAGDVSFHNGLTVHGAGPNRTGNTRRAMTLQMMPAGRRRPMLDGAGSEVPIAPRWHERDAPRLSGRLSQEAFEGVFNGKQNILSDRTFANLEIGDPLIPEDFHGAEFAARREDGARRRFRTMSPKEIEAAAPGDLHPLLH